MQKVMPNNLMPHMKIKRSYAKTQHFSKKELSKKVLLKNQSTSINIRPNRL